MIYLLPYVSPQLTALNEINFALLLILSSVSFFMYFFQGLLQAHDTIANQRFSSSAHSWLRPRQRPSPSTSCSSGIDNATFMPEENE